MQVHRFGSCATDTEAAVRDALAASGLFESSSDAQAGYVLSRAGARELSVRYYEAEREAEFRRARECFIDACRTLTTRGFALTLFVSRRTLALAVAEP